jgi:hypothetical protein
VELAGWVSGYVGGLYFVFGGSEHAERGVTALPVVEDLQVLEEGGGEFNVGEAVPGFAGLDRLRFVEADLGFHECVVQGVADGADGGVDAGVQEMSGDANDVYWLPASEW